MWVIKGLIVIKCENHQTITNNLVCGLNHFKRDNYPPTTVCEVELNYLHIYVHSHYKKISNKELQIISFGRLC
jgi:hypothetical protein